MRPPSSTTLTKRLTPYFQYQKKKKTATPTNPSHTNYDQLLHINPTRQIRRGWDQSNTTSNPTTFNISICSASLSGQLRKALSAPTSHSQRGVDSACAPFRIWLVQTTRLYGYKYSTVALLRVVCVGVISLAYAVQQLAGTFWGRSRLPVCHIISNFPRTRLRGSLITIDGHKS